MAQENWMQNPYTFTGVPSLTPIHLKRRSESNNFGKDSKLFASTNTARRPSTSAGKGNVNPNLYPGLNPNDYTSESSHGHGGSGKPAEIRHPYLVLKRGKKHHAYSADVAPYPLNYETRLLDYDSLDNCAFFSTSTSSSTSTSNAGSNSPSLTPSPSLLQHIIPQDPTTHPRRVLDVGCGSGSWCINAASHWPDTHFVGVDLVAIQPDTLALEKIANLKSAYKNRSFKQPRSRHPSLNPSSSENVGKTKSISTPSPRRSFSISAPNINAPTGSNANSNTSTLENVSKITPSSNSVYNRIQWVHHNFLRKRLPFQENEFDLIHVRGIAHGVPEDKWDFLVSELARVLAPGGWLEIVEEDIIFPVVLPPPALTLRRANAAAAQQNQAQSQLGHGQNRGAAAEANNAANSTLNTSNALQDYLEVRRRIATKINQSGQTAQSQQSFTSNLSDERGRRPSLFSPYAYAGVGRASASGLTLPSALDSTSSFEIPSIPSYDVLSSEPYPGYLNIPNSYLHYAQTVPALAHSLPPLAVVNPFLHQYHPHSRTHSTHAQNQKGRAVFLQDHVVLEKLYNKVYTKRFINMEPTAILAGVLGMHVELTGIVSSENVEIGQPYVRYMDAGANNTEPRHRGSRRGSGGSRTLLDENADADIEDSDEDEGDGNGLFYDGSGGDSGDRFTGPPSPPLTPTQTATLDGAFTPAITTATSPFKSSSKRSSGKSGASVVSEDFKRFPALTLTRCLKETLLGRHSNDEYHDGISNADDSAVKAYHLQRAWENVVACKEAMWEELLADSERRDRDEASPTSPGYSNHADLQSPSPLSASIGGPGGGKTGRAGLSVAGGHPLGELLVSFPGVSSTPTSDARMAPPWPRSRRFPTLLDELEWVDSDERRTERERFDILIARYDTRIKRYCASAYEHSSLIPPIVARERQALKGPIAVDDSSSSDEEDQGVTRSMPEQHNDASVEGGGGLEVERRKERIAKDREGHSSSDDVTLAEPQSPDLRTNTGSATSASPQALLSPRLQVPLSQETPSTTAMNSPNSPNSPGVASPFPRTPTVAILPTGKSLKIQVPIKPGHVSGHSISHSRAIGGTGGGIGSNDSHLHAHAHSSSKGKGKEKERSSLSYTSAESQPSRIVRAFIATKLR